MTKKIIIDKDELFDLYINQNKNKEEVAKKLNVSVSLIKNNIKNFGIKKDKNLVKEQIKISNLKKYGATNYNKTEEAKTRKKDTCLEKYGATSFLGSEIGKKRIADTLIKKYNTTNFASLNFVKEKKKETMIKKYGVEYYSQTKEYNEKTKNTNISKYGSEYYSQTKECKLKVKDKFLENYGVDNYSQTQEYREKVKNTCLEKYGVNNANQKHITNYESWINNELFIEKVKELKNTKALSKFFNLGLCIVEKKIIETQSRQYVEMFRSYPEIEIAEILTGLGVEFVCNTREIISPLELDFYIPSHNIAIEFNGLFWHQDKDRMYHYNKSKLCEEKGIKLIHIWEHEWDNKRERIINYIKDLLKINITKLYARNCVVKELDSKTCVEFLEQNHLQGKDRSSLKYGLFHNEELVSIMSWCKPRFNKNFDWELSRYAVKCGYVIVGGASKLFKIRPQGKLISYQDVAKFTGNLYDKLGFKLSHVSKPNYVWLKDDVVLTRYQCQMKDEVKSLSNLGFSQVFDCGNKVWVY